jgi:folate-binding protein YgfZ
VSPTPPRTPFAPALTGARPRTDLGFEVAGDYGDLDAEYHALRHQVAVVDRSTRGLVAVTGSEALKYLHSLVSQDVEKLGDGDSAHTLLLQPQGKLEADLSLLVAGDECWLDCEAGVGEALTAALNRFRIRIDAQIDDRSATSGCLTVAGPHAPSAVAALALPASVRTIPTDLPDGLPAINLLGPLADLEPVWQALLDAGVARAGTDAYEAVRIEAGVPRQGKDVDDKTIPQEAFLERDAVSFTKGCFLGQELVCRIDTRGHVNKYLRGITLLDNVQPPEGADVVAENGTVGAVTSVAASPGLRTTVALATVRREIEPPATVTLQWDGGAARATVHTLPLSLS